MAKKQKKPKTRFGYYLIYMAFSLNLMAVLAIGGAPQEAFADAENPTCVELGTCMFANDPLNVMLIPFDSIFGGLSIVIFWALAIGILWLRTETPMLVGIVGTVMVSSYSFAVDPTLQSPEFETARWVGGLLLVSSVGISVYQLIVTRIFAPPQ